MFNKRKLRNVKYCAKKVMKDPKNLKFLDVPAIEELFNRKDYREWSYEFKEKLLNNPQVLDSIKALSLDKQRTIVWNLVTWNGELIKQFDESFLNDYEIAITAMGPDHQLQMPTKQILVPNPIEREMVPGVALDFDALENHYDLYPTFTDEVKEKICKYLTRPAVRLYNLTEEKAQYIAQNIPDSVKNNSELSKELCKNFPYVYPYLNEDLKKDPQVIAWTIENKYEKYVLETLKTLSEEEKREVLKQYYQTDSFGPLPEILNFAFDSKENLLALLDSKTSFNVEMLKKVKPELLNDQEVIDLITKKTRIYGSNNKNEVINMIPKNRLKTAKNVLNLLHCLDLDYHFGDRLVETEAVQDLLNNLTLAEYKKVVKELPRITRVKTKHDVSKVISEAIKNLSKEDVRDFYHEIGDNELTREDLMNLFVLNPGFMYKHVKEMDRDFFVESVIRNEQVSDYITDEELKKAIIIASTTIKYLNTKFPKITNEKELDEFIEKVKEASKKEETKTNEIKKPKKPKPIHRSRRG